MQHIMPFRLLSWQKYDFRRHV